MVEKSWKDFEKMCEASTLVKAAAEPAAIGEKVDQQIRRAARRLGWTPGRVKESGIAAPAVLPVTNWNAPAKSQPSTQGTPNF